MLKHITELFIKQSDEQIKEKKLKNNTKYYIDQLPDGAKSLIYDIDNSRTKFLIYFYDYILRENHNHDEIHKFLINIYKFNLCEQIIPQVTYDQYTDSDNIANCGRYDLEYQAFNRITENYFNYMVKYETNKAETLKILMSNIKICDQRFSALQKRNL